MYISKYIVPVNGLSDVDWRLFFNTFFWNINYWESAACFSADVVDPGTSYPQAMFIALLIVFTANFVPLLIGIGVSTASYVDWTDGYFVSLAEQIGGPWLGAFMLLGSAVTNIGMFQSEMSSDSWQVCGMAETGILPKVVLYYYYYYDSCCSRTQYIIYI